MKAVILGICPDARIVDITHGIPPGDIRAGAFALASATTYFPHGTVHVVVVDPGVGSSRPALGVQTANGFFVGPDNGVMSLALAREEVRQVRVLENSKYFLPGISRTFHGRDIFAPVAAHLSAGVLFSSLGRETPRYLKLDVPGPDQTPTGWRGEVLYIDRFGNAITNVQPDWSGFGQKCNQLQIRFGGRGRFRTMPLCECYQDVDPGSLLAIFGSAGYLEISANGGSAAEQLGLKVGTPFVLRMRA
jgi:S-adenosylmethionine hydrolase